MYINLLCKEIKDILFEYKHAIIAEDDFNKLVTTAHDDLIAFSQKDPSSLGEPLHILYSYLSYKAVLYYRISNLLYKNNQKVIARKISENAKLKTGIEIHPGAQIGKRFILDHGIGTVIGETSIIGDDCYFLQSIILGAKTIKNNPMKRRHPKIGNNVELGGFVRIFGNVNIGDNVKISPNTIIFKDIPNDSIVKKISNYQITTSKNDLIINGYLKKDNQVTVWINELPNNLICKINNQSVDFKLEIDHIVIKNVTQSISEIELSADNDTITLYFI